MAPSTQVIRGIVSSVKMPCEAFKCFSWLVECETAKFHSGYLKACSVRTDIYRHQEFLSKNLGIT